jgi:hypothetical protein
MTKCRSCCKTTKEYEDQFPTTLYKGIECSKCGDRLKIKINESKGGND